MKRKKVIIPNIIDGGIAIPLGNNYYYMQGRKHKDGGIDIGPNNKNGLEVEDGEIMKTSPKEVKVYSSLPFLNGRSPVEKLLGGENPKTVFRQQENYKDRNGINDDGTKKKAQTGIKIKSNIKNGITNIIDKYKTFKSDRKIKIPLEISVDNIPNLLNTIDKKSMGGKNKYLMNTGEGYFNGKENVFLKTKKLMGGLNRSKDYGSKSKPYPNVDKKDFAGSGRSYPIPTKADAIDALRLAGLHGRNDIKSKVYAKYPELKNNKKRIGGINMLSSLYGGTDTDNIDKSAKCGTIIKLQYGGKELLKYSPYKRKKALYGIKEDNEDNVYDGGNLNTVTVTEKYKKPTVPFVPYNLNYTIPNITINKKDIPNFENNKKPTNIWSKIGEFSINNLGTLSSAASNILSGGIGYKINKDSLSNMQFNIPEYKISSYYDNPIYERATNLKTKYNINPQLREIDESQRKFEMDVDSATSSSQTAIARKQAQRINNVLNKNKLYTEKENEETKLINADRLNKQNVAQRNTQTANEYLKNKAVFDADQLNRQQEYMTKQLLDKQIFENNIREKQAENKIGLISNINSSIQNIINNTALDKKYKLDKKSLLATHPNIPVEYLRSLGLITDKEVNEYRKAYPIKK